MTAEEIFSRISAHMVEGIMLHEQLCSYFEFLNLDGYQYCHKFHYLSETLSQRDIQDFYIHKYNKMIPSAKIDSSSFIPDSWYGYTRQAVDIQTKRNAVRTAFDKIIKWEKSSCTLYNSMIAELETLHEYDASEKIKALSENVQNEIFQYEKEYLELVAVDFNMLPIIQRQKHLQKKFKKDMKKLLS